MTQQHTLSDCVPGDAIKERMIDKVLDARSTKSLPWSGYEMLYEVLGNRRHFKYVIGKSQIILHKTSALSRQLNDVKPHTNLNQ